MEKLTYVRPFPVRDMSNVPEDTEATRVRNSKKLLCGQTLDLPERIRIPELFVEETSNFLPFGQSAQPRVVIPVEFPENLGTEYAQRWASLLSERARWNMSHEVQCACLNNV